MPGIYHAGVVTTIPYYDTGNVGHSANVIHWLGVGTTDLTTGQLTTIQGVFDAAWGAAWAALATSSNHYLGAWVIDSGDATGGQVTNALFTPVAGASSNAPVADNVAGLISLQTTRRYKGGHGRLYIPGANSSFLNFNGANWTGAMLAHMDTLWENTRIAMSGIGSAENGPYLPIVWHKKAIDFPNTVENVVGHVSQPVAASQRRRLRKVSRHRRHVPA
jgi:hypothetical protein